MPKWSKQEFLEMLGERAYTFAAWCVDGEDNAKVISYLLSQFDTLDVSSPLFINKILPLLLHEKVITEKIFNDIHNRLETPYSKRTIIS